MSQRKSGYERRPGDSYQTPEWCTEALIPHLSNLPDKIIWEPAAGDGQMARVLKRHAKEVIATDINTGTDFLTHRGFACDGILSNPPYSLAQEFIEHALHLTKPNGGFAAMLLRCDFDHAASRRGLFQACPAYSKKLVLTKRIRWIEGSTGSPSFNHAWFVWDHKHSGPPTICYAPVG